MPEPKRQVRVPLSAILKPFRSAALLALGYLVICFVYIRAFSLLTERNPTLAAYLRRLEMPGGTVFVLLTAAFLLCFSWVQFRRAARREADLNQQREALAGVERRAMAGVLAASIGHDINNMVMCCEMTTGVLSRADALDPQQHALVEDMAENMKGLADLAKRLSQVSRDMPVGDRRPVDLASVIREGLTIARTHKRVRHCHVSEDLSSDLALKADPTAIQQVLLNLVLNAADAAGEGGRIEVRATPGDGACTIEVHDDGPGIPQADRAGVFAPFYTTKQDGTGLGLLSARACVEAHRGTISIHSSPLGGACFQVSLPTTGDAALESDD